MNYIDPNKKKKEPKSMKDLLDQWQFDPERMKSKKYVQHEFQDFGLRLAHSLNDPGHKSLYIKLAKQEKRGMLEKALRFSIDYPGMDGKNKGKLFMWALKKLRNGEELYTKFDSNDREQSSKKTDSNP